MARRPDALAKRPLIAPAGSTRTDRRAAPQMYSKERCARKCIRFTVPFRCSVSAFKLWTVKRRLHCTPPVVA